MPGLQEFQTSLDGPGIMATAMVFTAIPLCLEVINPFYPRSAKLEQIFPWHIRIYWALLAAIQIGLIIALNLRTLEALQCRPLLTACFLAIPPQIVMITSRSVWFLFLSLTFPNAERDRRQFIAVGMATTHTWYAGWVCAALLQNIVDNAVCL